MFVQPFLLKKYYLFFQRKGAVVQRRNKVIVGGFLKVLRPKPFAAYKFVNTERNNDFDFDFTPIGLAIKKARTAQGMTREQLARIVDYDPRHLQAIENEGQKPSLELFIQLVTMFNISVDEYIFPNKEVNKSSARRRLDAQLDNLDDKELSIVEATANGLCKAKE